MKDLTELELMIIATNIQFCMHAANFQRLYVVQKSIMDRFDRELKARPHDKVLEAVKQLGQIEPELAAAGDALKSKLLEMASKL